MYRIVQELVNNILKYANASEFLISSVLQGNELNLVVFHNGDGLPRNNLKNSVIKKKDLD